MPIQDLARDDVVTARAETPVTELAQRMRDESVGSVVVTNDAHPIGIATDRDLATRVVANGAEPNDLTAEDVMSGELCTVSPEAGFYEAAQTMSENGVRRLPICSAEDELVGIVTADDLAELLSDEHQQLAEIIRSQRPPY